MLHLKLVLFSLPQLLGYAAFVLGVTAFLQKCDKRLKIFNASQSLVYAAHFLLLGNVPAAASSLISSVRSFLAVRHRSLALAGVIVCVSLVAGVLFARNGWGWLPVIASCAATIAIFTMEGIGLRVVLLGCTLLWLINNIVTRSIGGTALEVVIATVNLSTIARMMWAESKTADPCPE